MKSVLLYSALIGGTGASELVSSDRFLMKILDSTVSLQDANFQLRNLQGLDCIFDDSLVIQYFGKKFIPNLGVFIKNMPTDDEKVRKYLHGQEAFLKDFRFFFKMLRYSEDQKTKVSTDLTKVIRESTKENKCHTGVLYKDTLKTNFKALVELELYLRSRYGSQMKANKSDFNSIRASIDLFVESLDKQLGHEYYW